MYLSYSTFSFKSLGSNIDNNDFYKNKLWESFHEQEKRNFTFLCEKEEKFVRVTVCSSVVPLDTNLLKWKTIKIPEKLFSFSRFEFKLKASPVQRSYGKKDRPHPNPEQWLKEKGKDCGFDLQFCAFEENGWEFFKKKNLQEGSHYSITYTGILKVFDKNRFFESFVSGIGRYKTYGFGLLCLKPID